MRTKRLKGVRSDSSGMHSPSSQQKPCKGTMTAGACTNLVDENEDVLSPAFPECQTSPLVRNLSFSLGHRQHVNDTDDIQSLYAIGNKQHSTTKQHSEFLSYSVCLPATTAVLHTATRFK